MAELRTHLTSGDFLQTIRRMESEGFRLAYIEDTEGVVAVAGYRIYTNLFLGKNLYVDDLVTSARARSSGYGKQMLDWLRDKAREADYRSFHLDSGTQRGQAHKFYFNQGFTITSYHFGESLQDGAQDMHRSRLAGLIVDCKTDDLDAAADFWSRALGAPAAAKADLEKSPYVELRMPEDENYVEIQLVDHDSRVHIDIESDDIEAEVNRLEALGARRVANIKSWCVLEAPTGQRFCVVPVVSKDFANKANKWD
jgi:GNAT superfamily N-acetyltransferase/catechol 2,3-dioxygenase-like lactoylglutathione lyase family enzyme